jgi:hypothetical protein
MAQFEIDLPSERVTLFDEAFWRFVSAELFDDNDPDVRLDAYTVGPCERRVVTFGDTYQAAAFERHWRLVSDLAPAMANKADAALAVGSSEG